jgi:hypothetical protein
MRVKSSVSQFLYLLSFIVPLSRTSILLFLLLDVTLKSPLIGTLFPTL